MNELATRAGRLRFLGRTDLLRSLLPELERVALERSSERGFRSVEGTRLFLKQSALRGKHRLRHALRRIARVGEIPRLAEFRNLAWLRARGFHAPRPCLAGAFFRSGLPSSQFLCTEEVAGAQTLRALLEDGPRELRTGALLALARDLARLHALGFVHRDLFPRNLLVQAGKDEVRIVFLDAWRGGPGRGLKGPAFDLGCFFLEGASLLDPEQQELLLTTYREESCRQGRPLPSTRLLRDAARARARVLRRERRRRAEPFATTWEPPLIP